MLLTAVLPVAVAGQNATLSIDDVSAQIDEFLTHLQNARRSVDTRDLDARQSTAAGSLPSGCSLAVRSTPRRI